MKAAPPNKLFHFVTGGAFRRAFAFFQDLASVFWRLGDFALVAVNTIDVIRLFAPKLSPVRAFRSLRIALFANMAIIAVGNFFRFASLETFERQPFVRVMAVSAVRKRQVLLVCKFHLTPFLVNRRDDEI